MKAASFGMPEVALQLLQTDMQRLEDRMRDEKFARELYRALANNTWTKDGESAALSWKRAEELINAVRRGLGATPLTLAETGGEGTVDRSVRRIDFHHHIAEMHQHFLLITHGVGEFLDCRAGRE